MRYVRIAKAIKETGVSRTELLDICARYGQDLVRKLRPGVRNSPYVVDMDGLEECMKKRARASVNVQPRRLL